MQRTTSFALMLFLILTSACVQAPEEWLPPGSDSAGVAEVAFGDLVADLSDAAVELVGDLGADNSAVPPVDVADLAGDDIGDVNPDLLPDLVVDSALLDAAPDTDALADVTTDLPTTDLQPELDAAVEAEAVCSPDCEGRDCGDDGCGGSCWLEDDLPECDDGSPCTQDYCNEEGICLFTLVPEDELLPLLGAFACPCDLPADCEAYDDSDLCNETLTCAFSPLGDNVLVCQPEAGTAVEHDDGLFCNGPEYCDPATGELVQGVAPALDDGISCTLDACDEESDTVTHSPDHGLCNDDNACSQDICTQESGCEYSHSAGPCDDGDACTIDDYCLDSTCTGGGPEDCDDSNPCTVDDCDSQSGCSSTNVDDHTGCGVDLECINGSCVCAPNCQGKQCGDDGCGGDCWVPAENPVCEDESPCTEDTCSPEGLCVHTAMPEEMLQPLLAAFACPCSTPADCVLLEDADLCNETLTCAFSPETQVDLVCMAEEGTALDYDDGLYCNGVEMCDPASGEMVEGVWPIIDDSVGCTLDSCDESLDLILHQPQDELCLDQNVCTEDFCDPLEGCKNLPADSTCDDENLCTVDDFCVAGICSPGAPKDCNDQDECTLDICQPAVGCTNTTLGNGTPCASQHVCQEGECVCIPDCDGKYCGDPDGCDGTCQQCSDPLQECVNDSCVCKPQCDGKDCGADGCGGTCGTCYDAAVCTQGICTCDQQCAGRLCGNDNCGGSCGECDPGSNCHDGYGVCVPDGWVLVQPDTFEMGAKDGELCPGADSDPDHTVTITRPILVMSTEVTRAHWTAATGLAAPGDMCGCTQSDCPVVQVNWTEFLELANLMSDQQLVEHCYTLANKSAGFGAGCPGPDKWCSEGAFTATLSNYKGLSCKGVRLPTEAEWEFFARGGTGKAFAVPPAGAAKGAGCSGEADATMDYYGYYHLNSGSVPNLVKHWTPSVWGLYDLAGNVRELVWDKFVHDYYDVSPPTDPEGPSTTKTQRVTRSGDYDSFAFAHTAYARSFTNEASRGCVLGSRFVRTITNPCVPSCATKNAGDDNDCGATCP